MGKLIVRVLFILVFQIPLSAQATVTFDFTIDDLGTSSNNATIGDTISISFVDDSNFGTGITSSDFESFGINSSVLGTSSWNIGTCVNCATDDLASIFNFTSLGTDAWQLDLVLGITGTNRSFYAFNGTNDLQLGQTVAGSGPTSISTWINGTGPEQVHYGQTQHTLTARVGDTSNGEIPLPTSLALLGLGLAVIGFSRRKTI